MQPDTSIATPRGHARRSPEIWDAARQDYLAGESAEQVCWRYGLKERTFRDRARDEGWRRCDQPDPAPIPDDDPEADQPVDCAALADDALVRVRRALRLGRAAEAGSWMRLHDKLAARLEAEREAAARRARIERDRGTGAAAGALEPLRERLAVLGGMTGIHVRLGRAWALGHISTPSYEALSAMNEHAIRTLCLADAADPHCSHPDFSAAPDP